MEISQDQLESFAAALGGALRQQDPLTPEQQRVALNYRLIRNGLGNYGGHGDASGDVALIGMTQTMGASQGSSTTLSVSQGSQTILEVVDPLPSDAKTLAIYTGATPTLATTITIVPGPPKFYVNVSSPIVRVDVLDAAGVPIAAGVPALVTTPQIRMTRTKDGLKSVDPWPDDASRLILHGQTEQQENVEQTVHITKPHFPDVSVDDVGRFEQIEQVDVRDASGRVIAYGVLQDPFFRS